jgi:hypothetical protein
MRPCRDGTRARRILAWAAAAYFLGQLAFSGVRFDPEFASHLGLLRARIAEDPHRPLLLVVGSSRVVMAFNPERLPALWTNSGQQVRPFNLAHHAAGPVMNLMTVCRLLDEGIRPDWMVLEVMPPFLGEEGFGALTAHVGPADLALLRQYTNPWRLYGCFLLDRLLTGHRHQRHFLYQHTPDWVLSDYTFPGMHLRPLGGACLEDHMDPAARQRWLEFARGQYFDRVQQYAVDPIEDRAMRALLERCRQERIATALVLAPESSAFRAWYSPQALATIKDYLDRLSREYGVPVVDARTWVADHDFKDGHHVLARGAAVFTDRLARQVLRPLVQGRLSAPPPFSPAVAQR